MRSSIKMAVAAGLLAAGVGAWGTACTNNSETTPPQGPLYPYVTDFCSKLAEVVCNDLVVRACYGSDDESLVADREACMVAFQDSPKCTPPGIDYHHEGAEACIAAWQSVYADAAVTADELAEAEETCLATFYDNAGLVNHGCVSDNECDQAAGLECVIHEGATDGTCQSLTMVSAGEPCGDIDELCRSGYFCDADNGDYCHARPGVGETCSAERPCVDTALCSQPVDGTCEAKLANNAQCSADIECERGLCNKSSGDSEGVCAGSIPLYQNGAVCDDFK